MNVTVADGWESWISCGGFLDNLVLLPMDCDANGARDPERKWGLPTVTEKIGKFKLPGPVYIAEKLKNRKKSENFGNNRKVSERCRWRLPNGAGPVTPPAASSISKTANRALNRALNRASTHCLRVNYSICNGWGRLGIMGIVRWICRQPCPFAGWLPIVPWIVCLHIVFLCTISYVMVGDGWELWESCSGFSISYDM